MDHENLAVEIVECGEPAEDEIYFQVAGPVVDRIFREMAIRDTSDIEERISNILRSKLTIVKQSHPELGEIEAYIVAARLLKQMIGCYMAAVNQILP